jgi:Fanconi anemia group M protein
VHIIVDHREPQYIIELLREMEVEVEIEQLGLGDYILSDEVVIERKTGRDFVQSLYDNRLFTQIHQLMENYEQVILLLEDFYIEANEYRPIFGALSYLAIRRGIATIPSMGHDDTAALIERMCSWVQEEHQDPILSRVAPKKMSLPERQEYLLQGLEGVGQKTAKLLIGELGTPGMVFREIQKAEVLYTRTGNPKGLTGPLAEIKGIGPKFVEKNKPLLDEDSNPIY